MARAFDPSAMSKPDALKLHVLHPALNSKAILELSTASINDCQTQDVDAEYQSLGILLFSDVCRSDRR